MPSADAEEGKIIVRTQYHERHLIQQVPGARYDKKTGCWTTTLSWASCVILRGIFGESLVIGDNLTAWAWQEYRQRIEPALQLRTAMTLADDDPIAKIIDIVESRTEGAA